MKNGIIFFGDDFIVDRKFTTYDLKRIKKKYLIEPVVVNGAYESYKSAPLELLSRLVIPIFHFENEKITSISLSFTSGAIGWNSNTKEQEKKKKIDQDHWLKDSMNQSPPYNFDWGEIESNFDPRSCSSSVVITFK